MISYVPRTHQVSRALLAFQVYQVTVWANQDYTWGQGEVMLSVVQFFQLIPSQEANWIIEEKSQVKPELSSPLTHT